MYVKAGEPTSVGCGRNPANRENLRCLFNFKKRGKMIEQELLKGASVKELSEKYGLNRKTIEYYQKKLNKH